MPSRAAREDAAPAPEGFSRRTLVVSAGGVLAVALITRLLPVLRGAGLNGDLGYDDGVYYGAAIALVHGLAPYRDFLFLHPPGIALLLAPFAALGTVAGEATGFTLARLAFIGLGVVNVLLVMVIAGRRGAWLGLFGGAVYAVWAASAAFERTTILVAPQNALLLGALLTLDLTAERHAVSRRRAALAGVLLGLATAIQLWNVVPLGVIAVALAWRSAQGSQGAGLKDTLSTPAVVVVAAALTFIAVCLPFLVAAGPAMFRMTVLDQLARPSLLIPFATRLRALAGLPAEGFVGRHIPIEVVAAGSIAAVLLAGWAVRRFAWLRVLAALFVVQAGYVLTAPVVFPHYAAWPTPSGSILLGCAAGEAARRLATRLPRRRWSRLVEPALLVALLASGSADLRRAGRGLPISALVADTSAARCVAADEPVLLIATGVLARNLANRCPIVIDPTGVSYDTDRGRLARGPVGPSRKAAPGYQAAMLAYYGSGEAALFARLSSDGLANSTWNELHVRLPKETRRPPVTELLSPPSP